MHELTKIKPMSWYPKIAPRNMLVKGGANGPQIFVWQGARLWRQQPHQQRDPVGGTEA